MYDATLEIDLIDRDKSILMHVNKNHKSGKDMKFPLTDDFKKDYDEMLDYIFRFLMNEFGAEWYESNKSVKKSLQEGIDIKIVYCDDTPSEYIDDVTMNDIYDILDSSSDICKIVDVSGSKKKVVWTDEYGFERAYESKKSLKEMKIDDKKLFKIFKEKYEELSIFTKKDFEEYREYLYWFDKLIDTENEFNKLAHKFENDVKDAFSNRYCLAFMFALEDLGLLDAIKNGKIEESKKSMKESVKPEIQLMVNNIIDELIGEYSSKEWDALSANEKFDIVKIFFITDGYKSKYLSEVRDLVIENMNHPFNIVFESKKSARKYLTEGLRYDSLTLKLIQDDIELYFEDKGYDVKIIDSGMAKALDVSYIYICKGKDFNKIKSDDLYDFLYSNVINGLLYYNDDFNVVVKNKQIMIILPKTRDYTE